MEANPLNNKCTSASPPQATQNICHEKCNSDSHSDFKTLTACITKVEVSYTITVDHKQWPGCHQLKRQWLLF